MHGGDLQNLPQAAFPERTTLKKEENSATCGVLFFLCIIPLSQETTEAFPANIFT